MARIADGPNGQQLVEIDGKWHPVDNTADGLNGEVMVQAGGMWHPVAAPPAIDLQEQRVQEAAAAAVPEPAAPEMPASPEGEKPGFLQRITNLFANQAPGTRGDVSAMAAANTPEMEAYDTAKTDQFYGIQPGDIGMEVSNALPEASHTTGYSPEGTGNFGEAAGAWGTGVARAAAYDEDYAAILKNRNPGSKLIRDPEGNIIIEYQDGTRERINAAGPSKTDALQIPTEILTYLGLGSLYRGIAKPAAKSIVKKATKKTIAANAARESAKAGGYSAAKDLTGSYAATGEFDLDLGRTLLEAGMGGAFQVPMDVGAGYLSRSGQKSAQQTAADAAGNLGNDTGSLAEPVRAAMEKAGYNMDQRFNPQQVRDVNNYYMENAHLPESELAIGAMEVSQGKVPTNALISQDPGLQLAEETAMKKGEAMRPTKSKMQGAPESYRELIQDPRAARMEETIADVDRPDDLSGPQQTVQQQREAEYGAADAKFKELRAEGMNRELAQTKKQDSLIDDLNTNIFDEIRRSNGLTETDLPPLPKMRQAPDGTPRRVTWGDVMSYRDTISGLPISPAKKASAIEGLMDTINEGLEDSIWTTQPGVFNINQGGDDFIDQWRAHIDDYGTMKKKWDAEKFVSRATELDSQGNLKYDGREIADKLFGGINGKFLAKTDARRAVTDLEAALPDDQWKEVQAELKTRLMGLHKYDPEIGGIKGAKTNYRNFKEFVDDYPELAVKIFGSAEELAANQNLLRQADLAAKDPRTGGSATSNTGLVNDMYTGADKIFSDLKTRGAVARTVGEIADYSVNPAGRSQRNLYQMLMDNQQRAKTYEGVAPQVGGVLGLMANDPEDDFRMPGVLR